jgi:hypothetical protein
MNAAETGRQRRGIVGYHQIIGPQEIYERAARHMNQISFLIDNQQLRIKRSLHRYLRG